MASTLMNYSEETDKDPEPTIQDTNNEMCHLVWEDDPDESMCGEDVSGMRWLSDTNPVTCWKCLDALKFVEEIEERLGGE